MQQKETIEKPIYEYMARKEAELEIALIFEEFQRKGAEELKK